jgi:hypothetical protein
MIRGALAGFAVAFGFAGATCGSFLLLSAVLQPDHWPDALAGTGWVLVALLSGALPIVGAYWLFELLARLR